MSATDAPGLAAEEVFLAIRGTPVTLDDLSATVTGLKGYPSRPRAPGGSP